MPRRRRVLLDGKRRTPHFARRRCRILVPQPVVHEQLAEKRAENRQDHRHGVILRIRLEVIDDAVRPPDVLRSERILQLEDIEIFADADVFFDVGGGDFRARRQQNLQLRDFIDHLPQIVAEVIGQQRRRLPIDLQAGIAHIATDPFGQFPFLDLFTEEQDAVLADEFDRLQPGIRFFPFECKDQNRTSHRIPSIRLEPRQVVLPSPGREVLRFLDDHQLLVGHHRKPPGRVEDVTEVAVLAVEDGLVEIAHRRIHDPLLQRLGQHIYKVRLLPVEHVHGPELPGLNLSQQLSVGHNAKIAVNFGPRWARRLSPR